MYLLGHKLGSVYDVESGKGYEPVALSEEIKNRSKILAREHAGAGSLVSISRRSSADALLDLLAAWALGATGICLDPNLSSPELQNIHGLTQPNVMVDDEGCRRGLDNPRGDAEGVLRPDADRAAVILFTSGTTGTPKGVVLSFRAILSRVALNAQEIGSEALARTLVLLPTYFGHGLIGNALTPLLSGCDLVFPPTRERHGGHLAELLNEYRITFTSSVPSFWRIALRGASYPRSGHLKRVHVGSAPLSARLWQEIANWSNCEVVNCFGTTETCNWISGAKASDGISEGRVGAPWGGRAAVRDLNSGAILDSGYGEIIIRSPTLMTGYYKQEALTAEVVREGWYHTGDTGSVDDKGAITLTGRLKEEINRGGFKVQPAEIDALLNSHPAVVEACTFGVADVARGEKVCTAVKLRSGSGETPATLSQWCRGRVRPEAIPERWFFVEDIPRTSRGKINRNEVRRTLTGTE